MSGMPRRPLLSLALIAAAGLAGAAAWWLGGGARAPGPGTAPPAPLALAEPPAPTATPEPWAGSTLALVTADGPGQGVALLTPGLDAAPRWLVGGFEALAQPAWSPDGASLAFAGRREGNWDLYRVAADGGGLARLTADPAYDAWPAWSPDGRELAFVSYRGGALAVWRLSLAGPEDGARRMSAGEGPAIEPAWSPDGRWLAYAAWHEGAYRLEAVPAAGGPARVLAGPGAAGEAAEAAGPEAAADLRAPAWSPDGRTLAYLRSRHGAGSVLARAWDGEAGATASDVDTLAAEAAGFAFFPGGGALALLGEGRGARRVELRALGRAGRWPVASLPAAVGLSWASQAPAPGLPARAAAPTPPAGDGERPGLAPLADVAVPGARIHAGLAADFAALRAAVRAGTGRDFLGTLADGWRPLGFKSSASSFFSWHKTGRAFDTQMELRGPGGRRDMVLVREDAGGRTMWRMFLRAAAQDGSVGAPLVLPGWAFAAGGADAGSAREGGARARSVPAGYWLDFSALAERYGWRRIPSLAQGSLDWRRDWAAIEYWHYERRDGLRWFEAARQVYSDEELAQQLAPERLQALGIPPSRLSRQGFPPGWRGEG